MKHYIASDSHFRTQLGAIGTTRKDPQLFPNSQPFPRPPVRSTHSVTRGTPICKPYIAEHVLSNVAFIIVTVRTHTQIQGAKPEPMTESLSVRISIKNDALAVREVLIKATKLEVPFSSTEPTPHKNPCTVSCSITYGGDQGYATSASLSYLPNHLPGSSRSSTFGREGCGWSYLMMNIPRVTSQYLPSGFFFVL